MEGRFFKKLHQFAKYKGRRQVVKMFSEGSKALETVKKIFTTPFLQYDAFPCILASEAILTYHVYDLGGPDEGHPPLVPGVARVRLLHQLRLRHWPALPPQQLGTPPSLPSQVP